MDKDNTKTTINEFFKVLVEQTFTQLINVIDIDKYVKNLTVYKFLQLLIVAQINERDSLTELSKYSKDEEELQLHLHLDGITSQLSRKQGHLPPALFEKVFRHLILASSDETIFDWSSVCNRLINDEYEHLPTSLGHVSQNEGRCQASFTGCCDQRLNHSGSSCFITGKTCRPLSNE